jgi:hypothetical protein
VFAFGFYTVLNSATLPFDLLWETVGFFLASLGFSIAVLMRLYMKTLVADQIFCEVLKKLKLN